jgi:hypothetical protein
MTTSQLRDAVYHFKAGDSTYYRLSKPAVDFVHRVYPDGQIRTVRGDASVHVSQARTVKRLRAEHWPRLGTRSVWPSSPTVPELVEMSRRGITPEALRKVGKPAKRGISKAEFNNVVDLRSRVIGDNILGIRSDIKVPTKWLGHFRYRWNFLILVTSYNVPTGLGRFLAGQWIRNPHNLWLKEKCTLKSYLRETERTRFPCFQPGPW